ncbi:hypothetical protein NDU88_007153 [Pleurodeles waltl]|uniref:Uncharacterized protein n=1 Tax=Pleurodeles waltl TaxID=8319 RepID=A0AAV7TYX3_PLEWA|nr:hypothetical protein NDU88_007153 [Pleurodeles waltl]
MRHPLPVVDVVRHQGCCPGGRVMRQGYFHPCGQQYEGLNLPGQAQERPNPQGPTGQLRLQPRPPPQEGPESVYTSRSSL